MAVRSNAYLPGNCTCDHPRVDRVPPGQQLGAPGGGSTIARVAAATAEARPHVRRRATCRNAAGGVAVFLPRLGAEPRQPVRRAQANRSLAAAETGSGLA